MGKIPLLPVIAGALCAVLVTFGSAGAQQRMSDAEQAAELRKKLAAPNPLTPSDSIWIEELTYLEVRDRIAGGATTAIVATGGIEENGPYLATGKHNLILDAICPVLARELGNALCAPVVKFVPEGNIDPPSGAMLFPGSFTLRDETFKALLEDIGNSLRLHGFTDIVFLGDSGGNQRGMESAAEALNSAWHGESVRAHFIRAFYSPGWEETEQYTAEHLGVAETSSDGHHDDIWVTAMMMVADPESVRHRQRVDADLASINGVDISDLDKTVDLGREMVAFRARHAAQAIRNAIAGR